MKINKVLAFLVFALFGTAYASNESVKMSDDSVKITNRFNKDICEVYIKPTNEDTLGDNILANADNCLHNGSMATFKNSEKWSNTTNYDIIIVFGDGSNILFPNQKLVTVKGKAFNVVLGQ